MHKGEITILLNQAKMTDRFDINKIYSLLFQEIKQVAVFQLSKTYNNDTFSPTVLVDECYIKLIKQGGLKYFLSDFSTAMRRYTFGQIRSKHRIKSTSRNA